MTDTEVYASIILETPGDDIRLRRTVRAESPETAPQDVLALLVELADEMFGHYGFEPMFGQVVAADALLDGEPVPSGAEDGPLVDKVRELLARVAWAEDPANWTVHEGGRNEDGTTRGIKLTLNKRPDGWTPPPAEPPTHTAGGADLTWLPDGELRTQVAMIMESNPDPEAMAKLNPQAVRIANQLARQVIRTRYIAGSEQPDDRVQAVRCANHLAAEPPLDILYVREHGRWRANGTDGNGALYGWLDISNVGALIDASDESRYGVRDNLAGRLVFDRVRGEEFDVPSVAEGWRIVDMLHAAATPPQILARRAARAAQPVGR
jgi:hypothetical protein